MNTNETSKTTGQVTGPVRRPSWIEFTIPGTEVQNYRQEFPTKGKAKRFARMLRREHGSSIKIERSWIAEAR